MRDFFSYDGKLFSGLSFVVNCVLLELLWILFSLPVFTAGAATSAACHVADKVLYRKESYFFREFLTGFKENFKQGTAVGILLALCEGILFLNYRITMFRYEEGISPYKMYLLAMILMGFFGVWGISAFTYMTRFRNTLYQVIRNSLLIFTRSIVDTIYIISVLAAGAFLIKVAFPLVIFLPSVMLTLCARFFERIYRICLRAEEEGNKE